MITTQANKTFLNGKLNLAKPYPTMEQTSSSKSVKLIVYRRSLAMVGK